MQEVHSLVLDPEREENHFHLKVDGMLADDCGRNFLLRAVGGSRSNLAAAASALVAGFPVAFGSDWHTEFEQPVAHRVLLREVRKLGREYLWHFELVEIVVTFAFVHCTISYVGSSFASARNLRKLAAAELHLEPGMAEVASIELGQCWPGAARFAEAWSRYVTDFVQKR